MKKEELFINNIKSIFGLKDLRTNSKGISKQRIWYSITNKIKKIFIEQKGNFEKIQWEKNKNYISFNFKKEVKKNTFFYAFIQTLFFFGIGQNRSTLEIIENKKVYINNIFKYNSFEKYLKSDECVKNILKNFRKDKDFIQKNIKMMINHFESLDGKKNKLFHFYKLIPFYENQKKLFNQYISFLNSKDTNTKYKEKILQEIDPEIRKLRKEFVDKINEEFYKKNKKNKWSNIIKTFSTDLKIQVVDRAHIIPVWYLIENKREKEIADNNNGLILDPNTHRMLDDIQEVKFNIEEGLIYSTNNKHKMQTFKIHKDFLTKERIAFMKEYNKSIYNKKKY